MQVPFSSIDFRSACSRFSTGITVATSLTATDEPVGITVSSFTSVSLEPPLVLVCIHEHSRVLPDFLRDGRFGLNVLADHQEGLSSRFARNAADHFKGVDWKFGHTGVPLLSGVLATFECRLRSVIPAGDHHILIGEVRVLAEHEGTPLIFFRSRFHCLKSTGETETVGSAVSSALAKRANS